MATKEQQHIAIIGGGPGGLMLALALQKKGIRSTIYEREISDQNAKRGGTLDIHEDSGQLALREVGLLEQFQALARYSGQDLPFSISMEKSISIMWRTTMHRETAPRLIEVNYVGYC